MQGKNIFKCRDTNQKIMEAFQEIHAIQQHDTTTEAEAKVLREIKKLLYEASEKLESLDW